MRDWTSVQESKAAPPETSRALYLGMLRPVQAWPAIPALQDGAPIASPLRSANQCSFLCNPNPLQHGAKTSVPCANPVKTMVLPVD